MKKNCSTRSTNTTSLLSAESRSSPKPRSSTESRPSPKPRSLTESRPSADLHEQLPSDEGNSRLSKGSRSLVNLGYASLPYFSLEGYQGPAKVVDIYDGDTLSIIIDHPKIGLIKFRTRLSGIDCEELRQSRSLPQEEREQRGGAAKEARDLVAATVLGCQIETVENLNRYELRDLLTENKRLQLCQLGEFDKYGRVLIRLHSNLDRTSPTLSEILHQADLAKK